MIKIRKREKNLGEVITPPKTAEYIISRLGKIKKNQKILDPCVGPGIFVKKLLEAGINKHQIFTYDINSYFKPEIEELGVFFKTQDTLLSLYPDSYNQFDFIVGNPPYLNKASSYVKKNKLKLRKIYGKINSHESYAMFIVNSIWRLKEGGKLGFITSDSFLTLNTHKKLRKFILNNCKINEILLPTTNLFSNQKVSTSPAIILLTKYSGQQNKKSRENNIMRIIPRLVNEEEYKIPSIVREIKQIKYNSLPFNIFFTDVEEKIINLFEIAPRLEKFIQGFIGMHTHDNRKYITAIEGTTLAILFQKRNGKIEEIDQKFKIIRREDLGLDRWKPYFKRGGAEQYYRPIMEALDWDPNSVVIYDIPNNVPFESEGIIISGVSSKLAARYMPKGCYWDSNKAIGFIIKDKSLSIEYILGLLNSSLYNYLAKGIINNTNSIQISGIHSLPMILPNNNTKIKIERIVKQIINMKKRDLSYNYKKEQRIIDKLVFDYYSSKFNFSHNLRRVLENKYSSYSN